MCKDASTLFHSYLTINWVLIINVDEFLMKETA